jgi:hypothetical protein
VALIVAKRNLRSAQSADDGRASLAGQATKSAIVCPTEGR